MCLKSHTAWPGMPWRCYPHKLPIGQGKWGKTHKVTHSRTPFISPHLPNFAFLLLSLQVPVFPLTRALYLYPSQQPAVPALHLLPHLPGSFLPSSSLSTFRITQTFWECSVKGLLSITLVTLPAHLQTTYTTPSPAGFQRALGSLYDAAALPKALLPIPTPKSNQIGGMNFLAVSNR